MTKAREENALSRKNPPKRSPTRSDTLQKQPERTMSAIHNPSFQNVLQVPLMSQSKGGQRRKNRLPASRARLSSSSKTGSSRFSSGANFAKTLDVEILTFDGQVEAYYQIKWPFSNNMATLKCLISLRPSSQPKTAPDSKSQIDRSRSLCTLPEGPFGSSGRKRIRRGDLKSPTRSQHHPRNSSSETQASDLRTTAASTS